MLDIDCMGERLVLSAQRALIWPRRRTLIIGDSHFGKGAVFRRTGLALPAGSTQTDLDRLSSLVNQHAIERVIVLGDVFHGRMSADDPFMAGFERFRQCHQALDMAAITGNHDRWTRHSEVRHLIRWLEDGAGDEPFRFLHEFVDKTDNEDGGYALSGHLHPVVRLYGRGRDRLTTPVFWFRQNYAVLPAFGSFTGGYRITPQRAERVYAVVPEAVIEVPLV